MKYAVPTKEQEEILRRNSIDPEKVMVSHADEDSIHLICSKTRDTIAIYRGDKPW